MMKLSYLPLLLAALAVLGPAQGSNAEGDNPRIHCSRTGGQIQETGRASVYICCYPEKRKCVATDTAHRLSWIVPLQPNNVDAGMVDNYPEY